MGFFAIFYKQNGAAIRYDMLISLLEVSYQADLLLPYGARHSAGFGVMYDFGRDISF